MLLNPLLRWIALVAVVGAACGTAPAVDSDGEPNTARTQQTTVPTSTPGVTEPPSSFVNGPGTGVSALVAPWWTPLECPLDPLMTTFGDLVSSVQADGLMWVEYEATGLVSDILGVADEARDRAARIEADPELTNQLLFIDVDPPATGEVLVGAAPPVLRLTYDTIVDFAAAVSALEVGSVIVGHHDRPSARFVSSLVVVDEAGDAFFVRRCSQMMTEELWAASTELPERTEGTAAVLRAVLRDDPLVVAVFDVARAQLPTVSWIDTPPDQRVLDPEEAPADVLSELELVDITLDLSEAWRTLDAVICTRTALGWNECARLDLIEVAISAYVVPGEPLQFLILGPDARFSDIIADLGAVTLPESGTPSFIVTVRPPSLADVAGWAGDTLTLTQRFP